MLILGQTGVGKEVMARAVHRLSGRQGPFVPVNCGSFSETLIASELFGVEKGAYSGAHKARSGLVRQAHGGTLFLDEVAELPLSSQVVLLRTLQEGTVIPVGGSAPVSVDVRVLAATNQDVEARAEAGTFRQDLLARLRGYTVNLPPLRQRREDIGLLIAQLLPACADARAADIRLSRRAGGQLFIYRWPDNVRELEKTLQAAVLLSDGETIALRHLPEHIAEAVPAGGSGPAGSGRGDGDEGASANETTRLRLLYHLCSGNLSAMARELKTSRTQVRRLLDRHGIGPRR